MAGSIFFDLLNVRWNFESNSKVTNREIREIAVLL